VAESPRLSWRAKWVALVAVLLLGAVVVLAAAEGLVRVRQLVKYGTATSYEGLFRVDETTKLRVLVPGPNIGNATINAAGFRGPEIDVPKPPGRIRLAFLGASTTFCAEVSNDAAVWPNLVVERLRARFPEARFDFVNGGVPGYTVRDSILGMARRDNRQVAVATFSTQLRAEQSPQEKKRAAVSALVYMPNMGLDGLLFGYARYNDIIRTVARDRGALLIEGENDIPGDRAHFVDTVHFNDAGSRKMAERVFKALSNDPAFLRLVASRQGH